MTSVVSVGHFAEPDSRHCETKRQIPAGRPRASIGSHSDPAQWGHVKCIVCPQTRLLAPVPFPSKSPLHIRMRPGLSGFSQQPKDQVGNEAIPQFGNAAAPLRETLSCPPTPTDWKLMVECSAKRSFLALQITLPLDEAVTVEQSR